MRRYGFHFLRKGKDEKIFDLFLPAMAAIFFFLSFSSVGAGFERVFQVNHEATEGNSVFPLSDGYLVLTSHNGRQNLTKLDPLGNMVLSKDFFDASGGWPRSAAQTRDGGYLIAGLINTTPRKGYLIKLDEHLETQWGKELSQEGDIWVGSAKETSDGGSIALARGEDFIEIMKLKEDGSLDWQKRIMTGGGTEVYDIHEVGDGTKNSYVILEEFDDAFFGRVLFLGAVGGKGDAILWQWALIGFDSRIEQLEKGGPYPGVSNILRIDGSNFAVAASGGKNGSDSILLISFTGAGHLNSLQRIDGSKDDRMDLYTGGPSFIKLSDGNLLLSGYGAAHPEATVFPFLMNLRSDLSGILWQHTYIAGDCFKGQSGFFTGVSESSAGIIATGKTIGKDSEAFLMSFSKEGANSPSCLSGSSSALSLNPDLLIEAIRYPSQLKEGIITLSDMILPVKGLPLDINPPIIDFGAVCGAASPPQRATFTNSFTSIIYMGDTTIAPSGAFQVYRNGCTPGLGLWPYSGRGPTSCDVDVLFSPPAAGSFSGTLSVCYTFDPYTPVYYCNETVTLTGTGGQPLIHVAPTTVDFGNVCVGSSQQQTVTVRNDGDCPASLGTIGAPAEPFRIVKGTCSDNQTLDPGGSCTVNVRYSPTSVGSFNSSFALSSVNVILTGTSGQQHIIVNPTDVTFDNVAKGKSSEKTILVTNGATCDVRLTLKSISPPEPPFSLVGGTCKATVLEKGESCTLVVRFSPTQAGAFASSLTIASDDPDEPAATVNLRGGSGPDLVGELASPLVKQCRNTWKGAQCTVKAVLKIKNIGTNDAPPCCVEFYLSGSERYRQGDPLLMRADTNGVRVGKSQTVRFNIALPPGETGLDKFLTFILNATHCFIEANEANNSKSYRIP